MKRLALILVAAGVWAVYADGARAADPQVAGLQVALRAHGVYKAAIDGLAGPQTRAAVLAFQRRKGLAVDGRVGPRTRAALGPLGRPRLGGRLIVRGSFGLDVAALQFLLARRGAYDGALDGYMGRETYRALRAYQRRRGLMADGVGGPATLAALRGGATVPRPSRTTTAAAPGSVRALVDRTARRYGVDPALARALAWMESGYQTNLTSSAGAWGVMQLIPATWDYVETVLLGRNVPRTAAGNVEAGVVLLRHLLRRFGGNERLALAAWYQGEHAVRKHGVYKVSEQFVAAVLALRRRGV